MTRLIVRGVEGLQKPMLNSMIPITLLSQFRVQGDSRNHSVLRPELPYLASVNRKIRKEGEEGWCIRCVYAPFVIDWERYILRVSNSSYLGSSR